MYASTDETSHWRFVCFGISILVCFES
jgi:hypothetical protein